MITYRYLTRFFKILLASVIVLCISSCSTKKNTFSRRFYHNLTARYNVYFNGKEAFKEGVFMAEEAHKDNYSDVLPMYISSDKEACNAATSNMDRAIEKSSKLIKRHSITARPKVRPNMQLSPEQAKFNAKKDFCNWVDDAYFLMGKSYLYKHDYTSAERNFSYVVNEFKNEGLKDPATIWLARAKAEDAMYDDAQEILDKLANESSFQPKYAADYAAAYANTLIKARRYKDAIPRLEDAISLAKTKRQKVRYRFILAQLYQKTNENAKALELYASVIKMGAPYDMEFNAKINLATSYEKGNNQDIKKMLYKLMKDEKNKDYLDQVYFALANIAYKEGDIDKALELYKLSVSKSVSNKYQKAMSFLALGTIYYDRKKYIDAQPCYDSCVTFLSDDYPDYQKLSEKSANLNELADNYKVVVVEDSLQRMAKMNPQERNKLIDKAIKRIIEKEEEERQIINDAATTAMLLSPTNKAPGAKTGSWYFYNTSSVQQGKAEFVRQWGVRKLEDDWRRKNKSVVEDADEDTTSSIDSAKVKKQQLSNKKREYYMQDVPLTDSAMKVSVEKMSLAQYNMGTIFMNKIDDPNQAIVSFEEFVKRFPGSDYMVMVYYNLYVLYNQQGNQAKADYYKNLVISQYPDSKFAQAIINPNFVRDYKARESKIETLFKKAYKSYFSGNFNDVVQIVAEIERDFPACESMPKFQFLKTLSSGRQASAGELKKGLETYVSTFTKDSATILAKRIIAFIDQQKEAGVSMSSPVNLLVKDSSVAGQSSQQPQTVKPEVPIYFYNEGVPHYYVIAAKADVVSTSRVKFNLINYNLEYFSNFNFEIQEKTLNKHYNLVVLKTLVDNKQALNYFDLTTLSDELFEGVDKAAIDQFIISEPNFEALMKDVQLERYTEFFYQNYIK